MKDNVELPTLKTETNTKQSFVLNPDLIEMAMAGINKKVLAGYGGEAHCFISDDDVAASAKAQGVTRAQAAVDKALSLSKPLVFVVGNTPTALLRIHALVSSRTRMVTDTLTLLRPNGLTRVPLFHFTPHSLHSSLQRLS